MSLGSCERHALSALCPEQGIHSESVKAFTAEAAKAEGVCCLSGLIRGVMLVARLKVLCRLLQPLRLAAPHTGRSRQVRVASK